MLEFRCLISVFVWTLKRRQCPLMWMGTKETQIIFKFLEVDSLARDDEELQKLLPLGNPDQLIKGNRGKSVTFNETIETFPGI